MVRLHKILSLRNKAEQDDHASAGQNFSKSQLACRVDGRLPEIILNRKRSKVFIEVYCMKFIIINPNEVFHTHFVLVYF